MTSRNTAHPEPGSEGAPKHWASAVLPVVGVGIAAAIVWCALVFVAADRGWGRSMPAPAGDTDAFLAHAIGIAGESKHGSLALGVLEEGELVATHFVEADADALFQVASLGKWLTAWGVLALVEIGEVDLDAPVSRYLTRWQLPPSEFDANGVTARRLLSHTAGLGDGLGYDGFENVDDVQSLGASLTRAADASPNANPSVRLTSEPGREWRYSGGGYTMLQLLLEEVSGRSFSEFMTAEVFAPLGMARTTFDGTRARLLGLAAHYDLEGAPAPPRYYAALAATSLHTNLDDLVRFLAAQSPGADARVLGTELRREAQRPHASQFGADIWGLGAMLLAPNLHGGHVIGHDGRNAPAINSAARLDPATGNGIVVLSTGAPLRATRIASDWVYWQTGNVDALMFAAGMERMFGRMLGGVLVVFVLCALATVRRVRARTRTARECAVCT